MPMEGYDQATYGNRIADVYDSLYADLSDVQTMANTLVQLASGGKALELGIGTGRIALPVAWRGVEVHGVDSSPAMVSRLRTKVGGASIPVTMGNLADVPVQGEFKLIFIVFNTLFALETQELQLKCFQNVAKHLTHDGAFVVEAFVPDPGRYVRGQSTATTRIEKDKVMLEVAQHEPITQRVYAQHVIITEQGIRMLPVTIRYAWPSEMDLMAKMAGLKLRERWSDWKKSPFTGTSTAHVSVYERG